MSIGDGIVQTGLEAYVERLLLRAAEVAEVLGVGRSKAYSLIAQGVVPSVRLGSSVRVPAGALRKWIAELGSHVEGTDPERPDGEAL